MKSKPALAAGVLFLAAVLSASAQTRPAATASPAPRPAATPTPTLDRRLRNARGPSGHTRSSSQRQRCGPGRLRSRS